MRNYTEKRFCGRISKSFTIRISHQIEKHVLTGSSKNLPNFNTNMFLKIMATITGVDSVTSFKLRSKPTNIQRFVILDSMFDVFFLKVIHTYF